MRGRITHHCNATIYVRQLEIDVVFLGVLDFDEGQFECSDVHLSEGRDKFLGVEAYKIPERIKKHILENNQEDAHEAAWAGA